VIGSPGRGRGPGRLRPPELESAIERSERACTSAARASPYFRWPGPPLSLAQVTRPSERLVCLNSRGTHWLPDNFSGMFAKTMKRQDELPIVDFHELRHTHASHLIWAGVPMKVISERLGHASITITMDRYGHLLEGVQDREAVATLEARRARILRESREDGRAQQETGAWPGRVCAKCARGREGDPLGSVS